jgi:L-ascorbate metabolism protein UlaG (beta-lactamase superfamily)
VHRPEILEDLERGILDQAAVVLVADQPAALADALQQEDVVVVEMGADAAAIDGVAHHQIVEARLGDEVEAVEERVAVGAEQVEALHQDRPGRFLLRRSAAFWGPRMTSQSWLSWVT